MLQSMTRIITLLIAALLLLAGCGDDKPTDGSGAADADTSVSLDASEDTSSDAASDEPTKVDVTPDDEPSAVLRTLLEAYGAADADLACSLQTERYTKQAIADAIKDDFLENGATCADLVTAASAFYKSFGVDPSAAKYEELKNDGKTARIEYTEEDSPQVYVLVNTDGEWLLDEEISSE